MFAIWKRPEKKLHQFNECETLTGFYLGKREIRSVKTKTWVVFHALRVTGQIRPVVFCVPEDVTAALEWVPPHTRVAITRDGNEWDLRVMWPEVSRETMGDTK